MDSYRRKWIFNHKDLPVSDDDKLQIKPLDDKSAMQVWTRWISNKSRSAEYFSKGDWPARNKAWTKTEDWQQSWDSNDNSLPPEMESFINWPQDTPIFFCYEKYQVIETTWEVFIRNWKCFLFFDNGPLLISPKYTQALMFEQSGQYLLGTRAY